MSQAKNIGLGILIGSVVFFSMLFVIDKFTDTFNKTASAKFEIALSDSTPADIIIITSIPYSKKEWDKIKNILEDVLKTSVPDIERLNEQLPNLLIIDGYSVISMLISKKIEIFDIENRS